MNGRQLLIWLRRNPLAALLVGIGLLLLLLMMSPRGAGQTPTRVVEVTRLVSVTIPATPAREVTRIVMVTPTPVTVFFTHPEPENLRVAEAAGPLSLDPIQGTDETSAALVGNVLETLLYPDPALPGSYLPLLASRWQVEEEGRRYIFTLRRGVTFSNGSPLTAADVVYSWRRLLLQSPPGGPQGLLLEPLLGYMSGDITEALATGPFHGDRDALLASTTAQQRNGVCEQLQRAIYSDEAGRVILELAQPWAPLLGALSQPWAGVISQEWTAARGDWNGDCEAWADRYGSARATAPLATTILGTGPYVLDHWTPGREYVLVANRNYWRSTINPLWVGGPAGLPALERIDVLEVADAHVHWELLRRGVVSHALLSAPARFLADQMVGEVCGWDSNGCLPTGNPNGPLRRYENLPRPELMALVFNFNVAPGANSFIGSGQLDGNGIPPNFFSDLHVRRALAYCLDEADYVSRALADEGSAASLLLQPGWQSNATTSYPYPYSERRCEEELLLAWGNQLPGTGFRLQIPYLADDQRQQIAATILQQRLHAINDNYEVETVGLSQATYLEALGARQLPLAFIRWQPSLPDPHYQLAPLLEPEIEAFQQLPAPLHNNLDRLVVAGLATTEREARVELYMALERLWQEQLPFLLLPQATTDRYEQRWLTGWFYHAALPLPYYYAYAQEGVAE